MLLETTTELLNSACNMDVTRQWQRQVHVFLEHQAADEFVLASGPEYGEETSAMLTIQKRLTSFPKTDRNLNKNMN